MPIRSRGRQTVPSQIFPSRRVVLTEGWLPQLLELGRTLLPRSTRQGTERSIVPRNGRGWG